jgi:hypothetical protein
MKSNVSNYIQVIPVYHLSSYRKLQDAVRKDGGYNIAVNFRFDKMYLSTSYDDVFDAFRLALVFHNLREE